MYEWTVNFHGKEGNVYNIDFNGSFQELEPKIMEVLLFLGNSSTQNQHVVTYHIHCKVMCQ